MPGYTPYALRVACISDHEIVIIEPIVSKYNRRNYLYFIAVPQKDDIIEIEEQYYKVFFVEFKAVNYRIDKYKYDGEDCIYVNRIGDLEKYKAYILNLI